ncbi:MAG: 4-hydroxy-tetrahydrodipicolinate reductase [Alphaproteobacteria bacterium]|nr:4-hydroxy-tetrahydrodipicolinate reductase [Alphaproteobacteria bacterium]
MKIGITGCTGRMGQAVVREAFAHPEIAVAAAMTRRGHPAVDRDIGVLFGGTPLGVAITSELLPLVTKSDAVVDFTEPTMSIACAGIAAEIGVPFITGTTGFTPEQEQQLAAHAKKIAIVHAPNMSVGVNLLLGITAQLAGILNESFDIEISDLHHRQKVDAPSGTALALGRAAAKGRGVEFDEVMALDRTGRRKPGAIGFSVRRAGDAVGEHTVAFMADGECIELTHRASNRSIFARGALRAALWSEGKAPGLYSMRDVLGV